MTEPKRILVAEDNLVLGDVFRFNLQRSGFAVTLVRDGEQAFQLLESQPFDVLVTDYEMPGLNGEELCKQIRSISRLDSLCIVMCSARGLELDRDFLMASLRISAIIYKPFSIREVTAFLETLCTANDSRLLPQAVVVSTDQASTQSISILNP
jgi:DNA-binding response OmpR family regulator